MAKMTVNQLESISVRKRSPAPGQANDFWNGRTIGIEWTPCTLGGEQPWFNCPHCKRRAVILYAVVRGLVACRQCLGLAYRCQRETSEDRAYRRVEKIRRRLGWPPGIANGHGWKPEGMHWRTFERLKLEHDRCANACYGFLQEWVRQQQYMQVRYVDRRGCKLAGFSIPKRKFFSSPHAFEGGEPQFWRKFRIENAS